MLIYFTLFLDETRVFLQLLPKLGLYSSLSDIKFDTNISNRLYSFGKNDEFATMHKCTSSII